MVLSKTFEPQNVEKLEQDIKEIHNLLYEDD